MIEKTGRVFEVTFDFILSTIKSLLLMIVVAVFGIIAAVTFGIVIVDMFVG